ncbi:hypothetical protein P167DRAFT_572483 [Morchella conica CCBAS932]|uniref:C2H2-type domain-containing protein n=1 Tax=Morchella conica CCBAS932 TaxID=1392247 RepID=A0A3N4L187_9PEZI|nr:hypothetical protein P167DRAFT_572483 [Morchella conica CCBAS932]
MSNNYSAEISGFVERDVLGEAPNVNENKNKEVAGTLLTLNKSREETHEDLHESGGTTPAISEIPSPQDHQHAGPSTEPGTVYSFSAPTTSKTKKRPRVRAAPGEKTFLCQIENCGKGYTTNRELKKHGKVHLDTTQSHECNQCDKLFPTKTALNNHKRTAHPAEFKCRLCDKYFGRRVGIRAHIQDDHPELDVANTLVEIEQKEGFDCTVSIFLCNVCPYWHTDKHLFKDHIAKRHKSQGTAATIAKCLAESEERDARFKSYTCTLCMWKTSHMEAIRDHVEAAHPSEDKYQVSAAIIGTTKAEELPYEYEEIYKCHHCHCYTGKSDHALLLHIKDRHEEWDVYELRRRSMIGMDSKDLLPQRGVPWFECNFCQKVRRRVINIKHHVQRVHRDHKENSKDNSGCQPAFWIDLSEAESKVLEEVEVIRRGELEISDDNHKATEYGEDGENSEGYGNDDESGDDEDRNGDGNGNGDEEPISKFRKVDNIRKSKGFSKSV